jgi:hypothetical protein
MITSSHNIGGTYLLENLRDDVNYLSKGFSKNSEEVQWQDPV